LQTNIAENGSSTKEKEPEIKENGKLPEKPAIHDASKGSPQSASTKKEFPVQKEKSAFILPTILSPHRSKTSETKKPDSTFIKVDYLKPTKTEKTKENVSRVLDFAAEKLTNGVKSEPEKKPVEEATPVKVEKDTEEKLPKPVIIPTQTPIKTEIKREPGSSSKHSSSSKSSTHHSSSHHKSSSHSSSSHHKSSSHKSSSSKDCSRCYRRSKIKKVNIGVQVRPDESDKPKPPTRPLEFEASHRVGVNRQPVTINTNLSYLKYGRFYHVEVHPNGGASIVHMYQDELDKLSQEEMVELVDEFFELVFSEDEDGFAYHVMGVVHDGARFLPDLLEHMAENYSNLTVKAGVLGRNNDIETCTMLQYYDQVAKSYDEGTVRYGPLHQISLVGKVHEEVGGYFPDLIGKLEQSPFLKKSMPWGKLSIVQMDPRLSNDGPILWIRPGEQLIPTAEMTKTPLKRQRARINELRNLQYLPRSSEAREIMFEDRTKAHADHVGMGHERQTTAAVGKFKNFFLF
jgi:lysine-specific demethylase 9